MSHAATTYDPVEFDKLWQSITPGGGIGPGTLFHHAKQHGWVDQTVAANATQDAKDILNGRLFAQANVNRLLFIYETNDLLVFSPPLGWTLAPIGEADKAAKAVVASVASEAAELFKQDPDGSKANKLLKQAQYSSTLPHLKAMIELSKSEPGMSVRLSDFDADPYLLGVQNGVLGLRKGVMVPVASTTLVSKRAGVIFDPKAVCPQFDQFLLTVQPDPDVRRLLQQLAGVWLTGLSNLQKLTFFYGLGANGKTTFIELMAWMLGDYSNRIATEMLMQHQRSPQGPSPDIVDLKGRRLIYCNEVEEGRNLADARVKELTGGDTLSGRTPYAKEAVTFQPSHNLVMVGNHMPEVRDTSHGMWRRMLLIHFNQVIPANAQDPNLLDKLKSEGSGILNWALAGLHDYRKNGLNIPKVISTATDAYRSDQDIIGEWVADDCNVVASALTAKSLIYDTYRKWAIA
ncbi:MAG: phage/plasmid primase, P4 family, partial [Chloroflexi bacterium]|nr:phage/plasmid primase, P4 family [Chloroflexota bacterium]